MAVPTITSLSPTSGNAGGRELVQINGTNFRVPAMPPPGPTTPLTATVAVTLGGEVPLRTDVISATLIEVLTPAYRGEPTAVLAPVSVVVTNLDANGVPIPGETVTAAGAFTYERLGLRPPAGAQPPVTIIREVVALLQRTVIVNTRLVPHTDFGDPGTAQALTAKVPALYVTFTGFPIDRTRDFPNGPIQVLVPATTYTDEYAPARKHRLEFSIVGVSNDKNELVNLAESLEDLLNRTPYMPIDFDTGRLWYPLQGEEGPIYNIPPSASNISTFTRNLAVLDIELMRSRPVRRGDQAGEIGLAAGDMVGANVETILI